MYGTVLFDLVLCTHGKDDTVLTDVEERDNCRMVAPLQRGAHYCCLRPARDSVSNVGRSLTFFPRYHDVATVPRGVCTKFNSTVPYTPSLHL